MNVETGRPRHRPGFGGHTSIVSVVVRTCFLYGIIGAVVKLLADTGQHTWQILLPPVS